MVHVPFLSTFSVFSSIERMHSMVSKQIQDCVMLDDAGSRCKYYKAVNLEQFKVNYDCKGFIKMKYINDWVTSFGVNHLCV